MKYYHCIYKKGAVCQLRQSIKRRTSGVKPNDTNSLAHRYNILFF